MRLSLLPMWAESLPDARRIAAYQEAWRTIHERRNADFLLVRKLPSGRWLFVVYDHREHIRLGISMRRPLERVGAFYDVWVYDDVRRALYAAWTWNPEFSPEPTGWYRHVNTARRRPDGDAGQEYIWE